MTVYDPPLLDEAGNETFFKGRVVEIYRFPEWEQDKADGDPYVFRVTGDLREADIGENWEEYGNYAGEDVLKGLLDASGELGGVLFDSEFSCFFAYCTTLEKAKLLAGMIESLALQNA